MLMTNCTSNSNKENRASEDGDRVSTAKQEKSEIVEKTLADFQLTTSKLNILFVAYKELDKLELYAKTPQESSYRLLKTFAVCKRSGNLGPKKAEGDKQVPEGFYHIDRFNPKSLFYLSLGINYPNELDKSLGYTGSDIFIHGKCQTLGCLPMTDDLIKEIYLYALFAKESGQKQIPVYIFPFEMTDVNMEEKLSNVNEETKLFWQNLQEGYNLFQKNKKELSIAVLNKKYSFK